MKNISLHQDLPHNISRTTHVDGLGDLLDIWAEQWAQFPPLPYVGHVTVGTLISLFSLVGLVGNGLVIFVFCRCKLPESHTRAHALQTSLAVADFLQSTCGLPLLAAASFSGRWYLGSAACPAYVVITGLTAFSSIATMTTIAVDRLLVMWRWTGSALCGLPELSTAFILTAIWGYAGLLIVPPLLGWGRFVLDSAGTSCTFDYMDSRGGSRHYLAYIFTLGFVLPVVLMAAAYTSITIRLKWYHFRMSVITNQTAIQQREYKVLKLSVCAVLLFCLSWTPYAVVALIGCYGDRRLIHPFVSLLSALFAKASVMNNPILYSLSHPDFIKKLKASYHGYKLSSMWANQLRLQPLEECPKRKRLLSLHTAYFNSSSGLSDLHHDEGAAQESTQGQINHCYVQVTTV